MSEPQQPSLDDRVASLEKSLQRIERVLGLQATGSGTSDEPGDIDLAAGGGQSTRSVGCAHSAISFVCVDAETLRA